MHVLCRRALVQIDGQMARIPVSAAYTIALPQSAPTGLVAPPVPRHLCWSATVDNSSSPVLALGMGTTETLGAKACARIGGFAISSGTGAGVVAAYRAAAEGKGRSLLACAKLQW